MPQLPNEEKQVHLTTRLSPSTLAFIVQKVPKRTSAESMDWSCCNLGQHLLHMATQSPDLTVCHFFLWSSINETFMSLHFQRCCWNYGGASTPASETQYKTCSRRFGQIGSTAWTSAVSDVRRTSILFKVFMKLQIFIFQIVIIPCIFIQYQ